MKMNKQHSIQDLCSILNNKFDLTSPEVQKISNTTLNAPNTTFLLSKQGYEDVDALFYDTLKEYIDNLNNILNYNFRVDKSRCVYEKFEFDSIELKIGTYIASTDVVHLKQEGLLTIDLGEAEFTTSKAVGAEAYFKASGKMILNIKDSKDEILETQEITYSINEIFNDPEPNTDYTRTIFNPNTYSFLVGSDSLDNAYILECKFSIDSIETDDIKTFTPIIKGFIGGQPINPPLDAEYILSNE